MEGIVEVLVSVALVLIGAALCLLAACILSGIYGGGQISQAEEKKKLDETKEADGDGLQGG